MLLTFKRFVQLTFGLFLYLIKDPIFSQLHIDGYKWSTPFSVSYEGVMRISLKKDVGGDPLQLRVAVRSGAKRSCFEVIFRPNSSTSPYRFLFSPFFLPYETS